LPSPDVSSNPQMCEDSNESEKKRGRESKLRKLFEVAALLALFAFSLMMLSRALSTIAITQLGRLTNTRIDTGSVSLRPNGSVLVEGLAIRPALRVGAEVPILTARKVYARFGIASLLTLRPRLKKISVHDFVFNAEQNLDEGYWNLNPKGRDGRDADHQAQAGDAQIQACG